MCDLMPQHMRDAFPLYVKRKINTAADYTQYKGGRYIIKILYDFYNGKTLKMMLPGRKGHIGHFI